MTHTELPSSTVTDDPSSDLGRTTFTERGSLDSECGVLHFARPLIEDEDIAAVVRVLRSGWLTTGEECQRFEEEIGAYLGVPHVVAMSSCTAALETALASLRLRPGARVGVPTWTFVSTALAVQRQDAVPVLLDVDPDTLNLSMDAVSRALSEGLDAIVPVHFGGVPVNRAVLDLCRRRGVPIVEDAAHAFGARTERGLLSGQASVAACFSFYATKNLTTAEGGALVTWDEELAGFARSFRLHGLSKDAWARYRPGSVAEYDLDTAGIKGNLPDLLAALGRAQLSRFDALQSRRRLLVERYRSGLGAIPGVRCVPGSPVDGSADHLMVVVLPESVVRPTVVAGMTGAGVSPSVHFRPLHTFRWFQHTADLGPGGAPVADALAPRTLSLPLHPGLEPADVDRVCATLAARVA